MFVALWSALLIVNVSAQTYSIAWGAGGTSRPNFVYTHPTKGLVIGGKYGVAVVTFTDDSFCGGSGFLHNLSSWLTSTLIGDSWDAAHRYRYRTYKINVTGSFTDERVGSFSVGIQSGTCGVGGGGTFNFLVPAEDTYVTTTAVNAASYNPLTAVTGNLTSVFASSLASTSASASALPLPTSLASNNIKIFEDDALTLRQAQLSFISPTQVNIIPQFGGSLTKVLVVERPDGTWRAGFISFAPNLAPGVFSADSSGNGFPSCFITRDVNGTQTEEHPVYFNGSQYVCDAINVTNGDAYLILYATGLKSNNVFEPSTSATFAPLSSVRVVIGGTIIAPTYVGASGYAGVQQINVKLPTTLTGNNQLVEVQYWIGTQWISSYGTIGSTSYGNVRLNFQ